MVEQRQQPPLKRSRASPSSPAEDARFFNQRGITNLQSGRHEEAEQCFSMALGAVDAKFLMLHDEYSTPTSSPIRSSNGKAIIEDPTQIAAEHKEPGLPFLSNPGTGPSATTTTRTTARTATSSTYLDQQQYDEGMYMYTEPLPLAEGPSSSSPGGSGRCGLALVDQQASTFVLSATLLYNMAQTHARRGQYNQARKWFVLALFRIQFDGGCCSTGNESSNSIAITTLEVQIKHNLGHCLYRLGKNEQAMQYYEQALSAARLGQLGDVHVASCLSCIAVLYFHKDAQPTAVLEYLEESLRVYREHFGNESRQVGTVLNNLGRHYYLQGDYDTALSVYQIALCIRRRLHARGMVSAVDVAVSVCNTGQTHHQRGDLDEAMTHYEEFLDLGRNHLGSSHRDVALIYKHVAEIYQERNQLHAAKDMYEKAVESICAVGGVFHPDLASMHNKLGNLCFEMGDMNEALKNYKQGLQVERAVLDQNHPFILVTLTNITHIHKTQGNWAAALAAYKELRDLQVQLLGPDHPQVAQTLCSIGLMYSQLKSHSKAFETYQEALRIQRDHYGSDDHLEIATTLNSIGLVLFSQRTLDLAKDCFTDSLRIRRKLLGPDHRDVAILWYNIATICLETGEEDVAIKFYRETLRVERTALGENHHDVILTLQHLGLVHQQRGQLDEALHYFSEALAVERTKGGGNPIAVAKLLNLIGNIHLQQANVGPMMECYVESSRLYRERPGRNEALVIAGYNFYGLSKLHPPGAPVA